MVSVRQTQTPVVLGIFLILVNTAFLVHPALAHKVTVFAWVDGDQVHVESKFSGGRKPKQAAVVVFDAAGNRLLSGQTDANGAFTFIAPKPSDMKIVLQAGSGHRGEWTIRAEEFGPGSTRSPALDEPETPAEPAPVQSTAGSTGTQPLPSGQTTGELTADQVRALVEDALDRKLKPIMTYMAETQQQGPTVSEILGGIGYIIGLVGLGAYIQFRRRKDTQ